LRTEEAVVAQAATRIEPLTPAKRDDFLAFFDHERGPAFSDNPEWARCYCHFYEVPRALDWQSMTAAQNRVAMSARIDVGEMEGFLAYDGDEVIGWMNAQPRHKLPHCFERMRILAPAIDCGPHEAAVIVCIVVAPARRKSGVARILLTGAIASLAARGIRLVDAFPFKAGDSISAADHYHGTLSMYAAAGFEVIGDDDNVTFMRKRL
jgi:ribosomal protein S18 acetylase RimI-like enzyme